MNIDKAKKILGEARLITESVKMPALYDLEEFYNDLGEVLDQSGYGLDSFAEFKEELDYDGYVILFTEGREVEDQDGLHDKIDRKIARIKRKLSRRWIDFEIDSYSKDDKIFVMLSVDDLSE